MYLISFHHISHSHYNRTLCFSAKKQAENPPFLLFVVGFYAMSVGRWAQSFWLSQMVTIFLSGALDRRRGAWEVPWCLYWKIPKKLIWGYPHGLETSMNWGLVENGQQIIEISGHDHETI